MNFPVTRTFELAVHLRVTRTSPHLKKWITESGGLKHPTLALARKAARRIVRHAEVHLVNVSEVTIQSKGIIQ